MPPPCLARIPGPGNKSRNSGLAKGTRSRFHSTSNPNPRPIWGQLVDGKVREEGTSRRAEKREENESYSTPLPDRPDTIEITSPHGGILKGSARWSIFCSLFSALQKSATGNWPSLSPHPFL